MIRHQTAKHIFKITLIAGLALGIGKDFTFGANTNVGTSAAPFLKIGAGARPTAMGDAFVGVSDDINALYFNPAGLAYIKSPELTAMHSQYFQDLDYDFGAVAYPTKYGSFGFSAATLKASDIERRGLDESFQGKFDTSDAAYGISYAKLISNQFSLGGTVRLIDQKIDSHSASSIGGDFGALYKFHQLPFSIGISARHFGQEVKFTSESDPLPFTVDLGFGANLFNNRLILGLDIRNPRDNDVQFGVGGEWNQPLVGDFRIASRAGYNSSGTDAEGASGLTIGGGLGYKQFELDVAWVPFGDLGNTFRYAALVRF